MKKKEIALVAVRALETEEGVGDDRKQSDDRGHDDPACEVEPEQQSDQWNDRQYRHGLEQHGEGVQRVLHPQGLTHQHGGHKADRDGDAQADDRGSAGNQEPFNKFASDSRVEDGLLEYLVGRRHQELAPFRHEKLSGEVPQPDRGARGQRWTDQSASAGSWSTSRTTFCRAVRSQVRLASSLLALRR